MKRILRILALAVSMALLMAGSAFAVEIQADNETASRTKTVTWWSEDQNAEEYRWLAGSHSAEEYQSATVAGSGDSASIEVSDNGNYTFYAMAGGQITCGTVSITTIDNNAPEISILNITREADGTMTAEISISDYFSVAETRIAGGTVGAEAWEGARAFSGGTIRSLTTGTYTILAKDTAGNISCAILECGEGETVLDHDIMETTSWEYHEEETWYGASMELNFNETKRGSVSVEKRDSKTGAMLSDAILTLTSETGMLIDEWVTDGKPHLVGNLVNGRTYTITESCHPVGYLVSEPVTFTASGGDTITIVVYDEPETPGTESSPKSFTEGSSGGGGGGSSSGGSSGTGISAVDPKPAPQSAAAQPAALPAPSQKAAAKTPEKLPQTGGFDRRAKMITFGFMLILFGGGGAWYLKKTGKLDKPESKKE